VAPSFSFVERKSQKSQRMAARKTKTEAEVHKEIMKKE
jgi:hypothetical protein